MKIIGLIGKAGVGKSTFSTKIWEYFDKKHFNCDTWNVDKFVAHLYTDDTFFKSMILYLCKTLDKDKIREILISNPKMMKLVEMYVEKEIVSFMIKELCYSDILIIDCANLHKFKSIKVDQWIEVTCPEDVRVSRLIERDGLEKANQLIELQKDLTYSELESKIVFNIEDDLEILLEKINEHKFY